VLCFGFGFGFFGCLERKRRPGWFVERWYEFCDSGPSWSAGEHGLLGFLVLLFRERKNCVSGLGLFGYFLAVS